MTGVAVRKAEIEEAVELLTRQIQEVATPERAANEKAYQKSALHFLGTNVPATRRIAKAFWKANPVFDRNDLWMWFDGLWNREIWELRTVAMILLEAKPKLVTLEDLAKLKEVVIDASCWAFNDWIGCHILGSLAVRQPETLNEMDEWAKDSNLWVRRVAMQSLLVPMRNGNLKEWSRFVSYAEPLAQEKDFWTRKVIGWVCREVSKKNPDVVFSFLHQNREKLSGLSLREGSKYLSEAQKEKLGLSKARTVH